MVANWIIQNKIVINTRKLCLNYYARARKEKSAEGAEAFDSRCTDTYCTQDWTVEIQQCVYS